MKGNPEVTPQDWSRQAFQYSLAEHCRTAGSSEVVSYIVMHRLGFSEASMRCSILILFLVAASLFAQQSPVPEIRYRSIPDFLKLPTDLYFGEVAGVAVNSKGHVFVFSRGNTTGPAYGASAAQLLEFGADCKFVREIGHNLYAWSYAHTVKVDREDIIWVTDKGSDMVIRFN